jgi:L-2-hydroxyglutarate oxidase
MENGLVDIKRLNAEQLKEHEPHVAGVAGMFVPYTGIVDYKAVVQTYAKLVRERDGEVLTDARVLGMQRSDNGFVLETAKGPIATSNIINCAGLQSDRVARLCGVDPGLQIVPFRGEYYELIKEKESLVRNLIYPVPDPRFPFLGVHFTRMIQGGVEAGPNAVLAFKREGYTKWSFSMKDSMTFGFYGGFWKMAAKYWPMAIGEMYRSFSKAAFVKALQGLIPELQMSDVHPSGAGVRAQALDPSGALVDDFRIKEAEHMVHVLNAPSPAATASLSIGETIADMAAKNFGL